MSSIKKILVVDDEADLLDVTIFQLEDMGYECTGASSGNQALRIFKEDHYDLVISDVRMTDGDGFELLKNLRANHSDCPVIILVSGFTGYSEQDVIGMGAKGLLPKPLDFEALEMLIKR